MYLEKKIIFWYPYGLGDVIMISPLIRRLEERSLLKKHVFIFKDQASINLAKEYCQDVECLKLNKKIFSIEFLKLVSYLLLSKKIIAPMLSRKLVNYLFFLVFLKRLYAPNNFFKKSFLWMKINSINLYSSNNHQTSFILKFYSMSEKSLAYKKVLGEEILIHQPKKKYHNPENICKLAIGISCGSIESHKIPSPKYFANFINTLSKNIELEINFFGINSDEELFNEFINYADKTLLINKHFGYSFSKLFNVLSKCDVGLSGNTGQGHMFAASGLRLITFTGVTNENISGPLAEEQLYLSHSYPCGPCYTDIYNRGCQKINCMDTISIVDGVDQSVNFIENKKNEVIKNIQRIS